MTARLMSGGEAVVAALAAEDVTVMFGIPGTHNLPVYRHLAKSGIRHVTPRHEQGGGYAADGYARASGRPGVVQATTGPGILNAITPLATAWADSVPVVAISPALPTDLEGADTGYLHETRDQHGAIGSVVEAAYRPLTPADAYSCVREAVVMSRGGRPRPRYVGIPLDVLDAVGPVPEQAPTAPAPPRTDPVSVERALAMLETAARPVIIAGGGARHAAEEVRELAERLGAPVVTTVNGKGVLDEWHDLSLGASLRLSAAREWLCASDVVLAVGTELGESDTWQRSLDLSGKAIRIDIDGSQMNSNAVAAVALTGDAAQTLRELLHGLSTGVTRRPDLGGLREAIDAEARRDGQVFAPLCAALEQALGDQGLLAADSTMATYFGAVHLLRLRTPGRLLYPTGYATLGYSLPAGIGAKIARPELPVAALVGDGGLMFTIAEIATAVECGLGLPIVVTANGGYGEIRRQMLASGITPTGVDLQAPDLPALAQAFGAQGVRVDSRSDLTRAIRAALDRDTPTLIEIPEALADA